LQHLNGSFAREQRGEREEMVGNRRASARGVVGLWKTRGKWGEWAVPVRERRGWRLGMNLTRGVHL
jgi:hypothetical protein